MWNGISFTGVARNSVWNLERQITLLFALLRMLCCDCDFEFCLQEEFQYKLIIQIIVGLEVIFKREETVA